MLKRRIRRSPPKRKTEDLLVSTQSNSLLYHEGSETTSRGAEGSRQETGRKTWGCDGLGTGRSSEGGDVYDVCEVEIRGEERPV